MNKSKNFSPGFIMVLHTFGRDLRWNPHIHCLISEGGYSNDGFWRNVNYYIVLQTPYEKVGPFDTMGQADAFLSGISGRPYEIEVDF